MSELKVVANRRPHDLPFVLVCGTQIVEEVSEFLKLLHLRGVSPRTLRAYCFDLLAFYRFLGETGHEIERLSETHLTDFLLTQRKQGAAPRTINRRLIVIRSYLNSQFDGLGGLLLRQTSPSFYKGMRNRALLGPSRLQGKRKSLSVKVPSILITPLTPKEIKKFLLGIRKYRDISILYLMLFCGLRSHEALSLQTHDVDLIDDQIHVRGKGEKQRILPISPAVRQALMRYLDYERPECDHSGLFVALKGPHRGQPLTPEGLRKLFRHQREKSIPKAHPHLFRHTFATNLIQQGVSLPVVQKLLGHADIQVTMGYLHLSLADVSSEYHQALKNLQKYLNEPDH